MQAFRFRLSPRLLLIPGLAIVLAGAIVAGLLAGAVDVDLAALRNADHPAATVLLQLRLPRVVLAVLIGAVLALTGAAAQALFRNPLAEPGLIGVSAGAALAAAVVHTALIGAAATSMLDPAWVLPIAAFGGGLAAAAAVLRLARRDGITDMTTMLLAGTAVNAFVAAIVGLLSARADDAGLRGFTLWMYGNLGRAGWSEIAVAAPILIAVLLWLPRDARAYDALLLGDIEARHLGIDVEGLKRRALLAIVLAIGAAVSLAGVIGFVGLIVPHAIRLLAGPGHRLLLPASALLGAALLVIADTVARTAAAPAEWPVGALTSALGAPFFLALLLRLRARIGLP